MIPDDDWDVAPVTEEDFMVDATIDVPDYAKRLSSAYTAQLCSLTAITSHVCRQFL